MTYALNKTPTCGYQFRLMFPTVNMITLFKKDKFKKSDLACLGRTFYITYKYWRLGQVFTPKSTILVYPICRLNFRGFFLLRVLISMDIECTKYDEQKGEKGNKKESRVYFELRRLNRV